jgi:hypothetical protein
MVSLVTKAKNILWISCQESSTDLKSPLKGLVTGVARVVRRENEAMRFVTLDVQQSIEVPSITIVILSQIVARSFSTPIKAPKSKEDEFIFKENQLLIPRIQAATAFNEWVQRSVSTQSLETGRF